MYFLLEMGIFYCYVSLPEGSGYYISNNNMCLFLLTPS